MSEYNEINYFVDGGGKYGGVLAEVAGGGVSAATFLRQIVEPVPG